MTADLYLYDDVPVLKNLLNLKAADELDMATSYFSMIRMDELKAIKLPQILDYNFFKNIHNYIFGDVFAWAGKEVEKLGINIIEKGNKIIENVNNIDWIKMSVNEKAESITDLIYDLWKLQPFRIGNFQSITMFSELFAKSQGFELNQTLIDQKAKTLENYLLMDVGTYDFTKVADKENVIDQAIDTTVCKENIAEATIYKNRVYEIIKEAIIIEFTKTNCIEKIEEQIKAAGYKPTEKIIADMKKLNQNLFCFHTVNQIYDLYKYPEKLGDIETKLVCDISDGFAIQETQYTQPTYNLKTPEVLPEFELIYNE